MRFDTERARALFDINMAKYLETGSDVPLNRAIKIFDMTLDNVGNF